MRQFIRRGSAQLIRGAALSLLGERGGAAGAFAAEAVLSCNVRGYAFLPGSDIHVTAQATAARA